MCCLYVDEDIDITYSYWDGSGHRKHVQVRENMCTCVGVV